MWAAKPPPAHALLPSHIVRAARGPAAPAAPAADVAMGGDETDGASTAGVPAAGGTAAPAAAAAPADPLAPPAVSSSHIAGGVDAGSLYRRGITNAFRLLDRVADLQAVTGPPAIFVTPTPGETPVAQPISCPTQPEHLLRTRIYTLLFQAMAEGSLAKMSPLWHAWF
jgi:hypothetical protein